MTSPPPDEVARRSAEAMWAGDRASQGLGMEIVDVGPGRATMRMTVRADMVNGHAIGHGGLTFTLADSAFAFACNSHGPATVAAAVAIDFLAPARAGDVLTAVARERWLGGRAGLYDLTVTRADGVTIAHARGRSHRLRAPVTTEERP